MADSASASQQPEVPAVSGAEPARGSRPFTPLDEPPAGLVVAIGARLTSAYHRHSRRELVGSLLALLVTTALLALFAAALHLAWDALYGPAPAFRRVAGYFAFLLAGLMIAGLFLGGSPYDVGTYGGRGPLRPLQGALLWIPRLVRSLVSQAARLGDRLAGEAVAELAAWLVLVTGEHLDIETVRQHRPMSEDDLRDAVRLLVREGLVEVHATVSGSVALRLTDKGRGLLSGG